MTTNEDELRAALSFSEDDLATNKLGRLTPKQKLSMERSFVDATNHGRTWAILLWLGALASLFLIAAVGVPEQLGARGTRPARDGDSIKWAVLALGSCLVIAASIASAFVGVGYLGRRNSRTDFPVLNVVGLASKPYSEYGHVLAIGDREFIFPENDDPVFTAFEAGKRYSVNYVFNTANIIVSAESD